MAKSSSSSPPPPADRKPVVVRVKRKANQERLDAFWLEINERPSKRALLDFGSLSISDSDGKGLEINERPSKRALLDFGSLSISDSDGKVQEEPRTKKLLVQHVETISLPKGIKEVLHSLQPVSIGPEDLEKKNAERKSKQYKPKQDQLRSVARQKHEDLVRSARFEQIWKSRRGSKEVDEDYSVRELCHLYDVVRVDNEDEMSGKVQDPEDVPVEDNAILCNYLPLIREFLPTAAQEIETEMNAYFSKGDTYVYDLYTVEESMQVDGEGTSAEYPLVQVQVDDDEYYDGPQESEYESEDSNAEDNPLNDYPDEESTEDDKNDNYDPFDVSEVSDSEYAEYVVDVDEGDAKN